MYAALYWQKRQDGIHGIHKMKRKMRFIPAQTMGRVILYLQSAVGGYIFWPKSRIVMGGEPHPFPKG